MVRKEHVLWSQGFFSLNALHFHRHVFLTQVTYAMFSRGCQKKLTFNESLLSIFSLFTKANLHLFPVDYHTDRTQESNVRWGNILCFHSYTRFLAGDQIQLYNCKLWSENRAPLAPCLYYYSLQRMKDHLKDFFFLLFTACTPPLALEESTTNIGCLGAPLSPIAYSSFAELSQLITANKQKLKA